MSVNRRMYLAGSTILTLVAAGLSFSVPVAQSQPALSGTAKATTLSLEVLPRIGLKGPDPQDASGQPNSAFLLSSKGPALPSATSVSIYQYEAMTGGGYQQVGGVYKTITTDASGYSSFTGPSRSGSTKYAYRAKTTGSPVLQSNYANDDDSPWGNPYFQDNFDGSTIDPNYAANNDRTDGYVWHRNTFDYYRDTCSTNGYSQGLQKAHPSQATVDTGTTVAVIGSRWDPVQPCDNNTAFKQTGNIISGWRNIDGNAPAAQNEDPPIEITYGVVATRVKLPKSVPNFTSVWLRPKPNANPATFMHEMDILEWFGNSPTGQVDDDKCDTGDGSAANWSRLKSNVYTKWGADAVDEDDLQHCYPSAKILAATGGSAATVQDELSTNYHVFSVFWPTRGSGRPYLVFLDGTLIRTIPAEWVSNAPAQIVMTNLINDGANDTSMNPKPMLIDWVRAWSCTAPCATTTAP